jgi:hypothetical protein
MEEGLEAAKKKKSRFEDSKISSETAVLRL